MEDNKFDINESSVLALKIKEYCIMSEFVRSLVHALRVNPVLGTIVDMSAFENTEDLKEIVNLANETKDCFSKFLKGARAEAESIGYSREVFRKEDFENYDGLSKMIDKYIEIFKIVDKIGWLNQSRVGKEEYLQKVAKLHNRILTNFESLKKLSEDRKELLVGKIEMYQSFIDVFKEEVKEFTPDLLKTEIAEREVKPSNTEVILSSAEMERRETIKKANNMYAELEIDFIRDLRNQVGLSVWDKYLNFMDVKYKKFKENFNMPLSDSATTKQAKAAMYEMEKLINLISEISEQSYVIGM